MEKLTSQQVNELANYFLEMSQALGDYRYQYFDTLSREQNQQIKDLLDLIRKYANDLFTLSAILVMDDVQTSLSSIGEITNQMKTVYKKLQDVQRAINIAASVVTLGEAILTKNPRSIADSIGGLAGVLND